MLVTLEDFTQDPEFKIGKYASICYDSDTSKEACIRRVKNCLKHDPPHLAILRFAYATFKIEGISRTCSHQLVRRAHLGFLQESQRYVEQKDIQWVEPDVVVSEGLRARIETLKDESEAIYNAMIEEGIAKQDARDYLLQAAPTRVYLTGNFQALKDFIGARKIKAAQGPIRNIALNMEMQLNSIAPNVFPLFEEFKTC